MKKDLEEKGDHIVLFNGVYGPLSLLIKSVELVRDIFKKINQIAILNVVSENKEEKNRLVEIEKNLEEQFKNETVKFKSQVCTTKDQSQRLLEVGLKSETADMYIFDVEVYIGKPNIDDIPAWSLHRLIEIAGIRAFSPVSSLNGWYDDIIAQIQSLIHVRYIDEKYLNMDIINAREEKNMELLKNN